MYQLTLTRHTIYLLLMSCVICSSVFFALQINNVNMRYILASVLVLLSIGFTFKQMQKRIDFKALIQKFLKK